MAPNVALFARVYPAGVFHFATLAGPPLSVLQIEAALAFLQQEHGMQIVDSIGDSVPAEAAHLLGRLWAWQETEDWPGRVQLTNTDGHALRGHKVSFRVADPEALVAALARHPDVEVDETGASWSWRRGDLHLGRLELLDRQLLLEVNSAERYEGARSWLASMPGVTFERVEEIELDPRRSARLPADDRLASMAQNESAEGDAPSLAEIQQVLNGEYFAWLDEPIPMLGGRTPRQACKTADGRRQVARLIRTYPDPMGTPGLSVPRAEMMRRLGSRGRGLVTEGASAT